MANPILSVHPIILTVILFLIQSANCSGESGGDTTSKVSVIVIGGGVSGLAAATKLVNDGGFTVTLLEADHHIGGRIKTRKIGDEYVEFGAEWVHGEKDNRVFELMNPLGYLNSEGRDEKDMRDTVIYATEAGSVLPNSVNQRWSEIKSSIEEGYDSSGGRIESLGDYATRIFNKMNSASSIHPNKSVQAAALDYMHRYANSYESSNSWFEVSFRSDGEQFVDCEGNPAVKWNPPATYTTFLGFILGEKKLVREPSQIDLPKWIELNKEVTEIKYDPRNESALVTVTCSDKTVYTADHVLSTVSLGVLKATHSSLFEPDLSSKKQLAINEIGFETVNKILLEFDRAWWLDVDKDFWQVGFWWVNKTHLDATFLSTLSEADLMREVDGFPVWTRGILGFNVIDSGSHPRVLQGWLSGKSARVMETLGVDTISITCTKLLRHFLGHQFKNIPRPIRVEWSTWYSNPYTRGSYSFRTVKSEVADVWARDIAQPILNAGGKPIITFAGEATESKYFSTVHGAYDSGIREGSRLLNFYKPTNSGKSSQPKLIPPLILVSTLLVILLE